MKNENKSIENDMKSNQIETSHDTNRSINEPLTTFTIKNHKRTRKKQIKQFGNLNNFRLQNGQLLIKQNKI